MVIWDNKIGDNGAIQIAKLLDKITLIHLDISNNNIGDDGAIHIAKLLENNKTLTYLDIICNNNICLKNKNVIYKIIEKNKLLRQYINENINIVLSLKKSKIFIPSHIINQYKVFSCLWTSLYY